MPFPKTLQLLLHIILQIRKHRPKEILSQPLESIFKYIHALTFDDGQLLVVHNLHDGWDIGLQVLQIFYAELLEEFVQ